jgi:hypothetical protein
MDLVVITRRQRLCFTLVATLAVAVIILCADKSSSAQSIKIGKTIGGSGFHIPSTSPWTRDVESGG